jgi:hypothetical protein
MSRPGIGNPGARQLQKVKTSSTHWVFCLSCDHPFKSWDPKRNRICPRCRAANATLLENMDGNYLYTI